MSLNKVYAYFDSNATPPSKETPYQLATLLPEFTYGGKLFSTAEWKADHASDHRKGFISPDGKLRLNVTIRRIDDYQALEYHMELEALGETALVENFQSLNLQCYTEFMPHIGHGGQHRQVQLRRNFGTTSNIADFVARPVTLYDESNTLARPGGGTAEMVSDQNRSSAAWLPYFALDFNGKQGVIVGIGWSGAWRADFKIDKGLFTAKAGLLKTHFVMHAGEKFQMPAILIAFRNNQDVQTAQNRFRKLLAMEYSPKLPDGSVEVMPMTVGIYGGIRTAAHLKYVEKFAQHKLPYDFYGIDAAWFGNGEHVNVFTGTWMRETGNWWVNEAHPNGLTPISDAAHKAGFKTWIWLEIERAHPETKCAKEHPDWFLSAPDADRALNLGNPAAWQWAVDTTIKILMEHHIDQLHEDFNINNHPHLQALDGPDRIGVTEIKYMHGLYTYWDEVLKQMPGLTMDHCASGGRRMDFLAMKRGHVIWRSDVQCFFDFDCIQNQIQNFYLHEWITHQTGGVNVVIGDDYEFFSAVSNGLSDTTFIYKHTPPGDDYDYAWHASRLREAVRMRPYFMGDFYQLTREPEVRENWCAYQLNLPDKGFFLAFRRPESPEAEEILKLKAIDPEAEYDLEIFGGSKSVIKGSELARYTAKLPPRGVALVYYTRRGK